MTLYYRQLSATSRLVQSGTSNALYFLRYGETQLGKNTIRMPLTRNSNGTVEARKTISSPAYRAMSVSNGIELGLTMSTQWCVRNREGGILRPLSIGKTIKFSEIFQNRCILTNNY
jgi:hypothetical protein